MHSKLIVLASLLTLCAPLMAKTRRTPYDRPVKKTRKSPYTKKSSSSKTKLDETNSTIDSAWEISLAVGRMTIEDEDTKESSDANRIQLLAGKQFKLVNNFSATTSLSATITSFTQDELNKQNQAESNSLIRVDSSRFSDIGLSQKLGYSIVTASAVFRPYLLGQYAVGTWRSNLSATGETGEIDLSVNYSRLSGAAGIEVALSNGMIPFIQYSVEKYNLSSNGDVEGNIAGLDFNESVEVEGSDNTAKTIAIGLGFTF